MVSGLLKDSRHLVPDRNDGLPRLEDHSVVGVDRAALDSPRLGVMDALFSGVIIHGNWDLEMQFILLAFSISDVAPRLAV